MIILSSGIGRALHSDVSCHRQLGVKVFTFSVLSCGVYCQITHSMISFGQIAFFLCHVVNLHYMMSCGQVTHSMM